MNKQLMLSVLLVSSSMFFGAQAMEEGMSKPVKATCACVKNVLSTIQASPAAVAAALKTAATATVGAIKTSAQASGKFVMNAPANIKTFCVNRPVAATVGALVIGALVYKAYTVYTADSETDDNN